METKSNGVSSPYQDPKHTPKAMEVYYYSSSKGAEVYIGKQVELKGKDGQITFMLIDHNGITFAPAVKSLKAVHETWSHIALELEQRAVELDRTRTKKKPKDKGKER